MIKTSIRFFENTAVRSVWDEDASRWFYCASDIVEAVTKSVNPRSYWNALKRRNPQLQPCCRQYKLLAPDGKRYRTDAVDDAGVNAIMAVVPFRNTALFMDWLHSTGKTPDEKSKQKAYELYDSGMINEMEIGTARGLQQIHSYLFGGLYDFAGSIRGVNIAKGGFAFAPSMHLRENLAIIEKMPEGSLEEIVKKYVEMNTAHPFREGNGRSMRIWLDLMLKRSVHTCTDWSRIDKKEYLDAMRESPTDSSHLLELIRGAQTPDTDNREIFMKGIDCSYHYEEPDD